MPKLATETEANTQTSVAIPADIRNKLVQLARSDFRNMSAEIRWLVTQEIIRREHSNGHAD